MEGTRSVQDTHGETVTVSINNEVIGLVVLKDNLKENIKEKLNEVRSHRHNHCNDYRR